MRTSICYRICHGFCQDVDVSCLFRPSLTSCLSVNRFLSPNHRFIHQSAVWLAWLDCLPISVILHEVRPLRFSLQFVTPHRTEMQNAQHTLYSMLFAYYGKVLPMHCTLYSKVLPIRCTAKCSPYVVQYWDAVQLYWDTRMLYACTEVPSCCTLVLLYWTSVHLYCGTELLYTCTANTNMLYICTTVPKCCTLVLLYGMLYTCTTVPKCCTFVLPVPKCCTFVLQYRNAVHLYCQYRSAVHLYYSTEMLYICTASTEVLYLYCKSNLPSSALHRRISREYCSTSTQQHHSTLHPKIVILLLFSCCSRFNRRSEFSISSFALAPTEIESPHPPME